MIRIKSPQLYRLSYRPEGCISDCDVGAVPTVSPRPLFGERENYTNPEDLSLPETGLSESLPRAAADVAEAVRK